MFDAAISHVIWDWNGTLLDDSWLSVETVNHLLAEDGLPTIDARRYSELFGWPLLDYYEALGFQDVRPRWEEFCDRFYSFYRPRERSCELRAGARELLADIQAAGLTQSVLSAYEHIPLTRLVEDMGLTGFFTTVLGIESNVDLGKIARGKAWMASTDLDPSKVLFVGDTTHDAEVAEALGVRCVLLASGHQTAPRLRGGAPGIPVLESLEAIREALLGNRARAPGPPSAPGGRPLSPADYTEAAQRTAAPRNDHLHHYVLGVCTEAGELAHEAKAHLAYGKELDRANLVEEMGDLCWYLANLMRVVGTSWEEVWERNVEKLRRRYPDGFEEERALKRDLAAEREALEGGTMQGMPKITLYHNPRCSKSRQTLALLEEKGAEVEVVRYLETPPSPEELGAILDKLGVGPEDILRKKEALFKEQFQGQEYDREGWIQVLHENPKLMERPIAVTASGAAVGRPPENVLNLL